MVVNRFATMGGRAGGGARGAAGGGAGVGYTSIGDRRAGSVQLSNIGKVDAIKGKDLRVGDTIAHNFGYESKVVAIGKSTKTGRYITVKTESGNLYTNRYGNDRLVPIKHQGNKDQVWHW